MSVVGFLHNGVPVADPHFLKYGVRHPAQVKLLSDKLLVLKALPDLDDAQKSWLHGMGRACDFLLGRKGGGFQQGVQANGADADMERVQLAREAFDAAERGDHSFARLCNGALAVLAWARHDEHGIPGTPTSKVVEAVLDGRQLKSCLLLVNPGDGHQ